MSVRTKIAAGSLVGAISLFGGLTAAGAVSPTLAASVHDVTGLSLPLAAHDAGTRKTPKTPDPAACPQGEAHGDAVSALAHASTSTGEAHGDAVSALASCHKHNKKHADGKTTTTTTTNSGADPTSTTVKASHGKSDGKPDTSTTDVAKSNGQPNKGNGDVKGSTSASTPGDAHADRATPNLHANSQHRP